MNMLDLTPAIKNGALRCSFGSPEYLCSVAAGAQKERAERLLISGKITHPAVGVAQQELLRDGFALKWVSAQADKDLTLCTCDFEKQWEARMKREGYEVGE